MLPKYFRKFDYLGFKYDVFIASFSEKDDQLSQWRGYADNGMGFSIGINPIKLQNIILGVPYTIKLDEIRPFYLVKVVYILEEQKTIIKDSFQRLIEKIIRCIDSDSTLIETVKLNIPGILSNLMSLLALLFKDPSYNEEQEWRFITFEHIKTIHIKEVDLRNNKNPNNMLHYEIRSKNGRLIPYVNFNLIESKHNPRIPLKRIIVGPRQNRLLAMRSLELLLMNKGYSYEDFPEQSMSNIPYA